MDNSPSFDHDTHKLEEIVTLGSMELGITLPPGAGAAFGKYYTFLTKCSRKFNLTAIAGAEEVARLHFLDSIALLNATHISNASVIDIGSGAGFPGLPMKIVQPSITLTLLDATGKRVRFLSELCDILGLNATCLCARAEEFSHNPGARQKYDVAISRAVARLNILCELCLPFVTTGGIFIAMKGIDSNEEITQARTAIETLGAQLQDCFDYTIPGTDIVHRAVVIRKTSKTADKYPRRFAKIQKSPL